MRTTTFRTVISLTVDVTAETEPRDNGRWEVVALSRVMTETGADVLGCLSITDRIALAQETETAAQIQERPRLPTFEEVMAEDFVPCGASFLDKHSRLALCTRQKGHGGEAGHIGRPLADAMRPRE